MTAGLVLIAAYLAWALRRGPDALINVRLLRHRALASSSVLVFLSGAALFGPMLLLPLYWQQVRGETRLGAALLLIPQGVGALASRAVGGRYMDRFGPRPVAVAALAATCSATVPFGFVTATTSNIALMATLFVRGLGLGAAMIALMGAAFIGLEHQEIPGASIISRVAQQVVPAYTALLAMILQQASTSAVTPAALASGFANAFWWATAFTATAVPSPSSSRPAPRQTAQCPPR